MSFFLRSTATRKIHNPGRALTSLRASTALAAALLITPPAQAQIVPPFNNPVVCSSVDGLTVNCTGDLTEGVAIDNSNDGTDFTTLIVTDVVGDIEPTTPPVYSGISFISNGEITITSTADIVNQATGYRNGNYAGGLYARSTTGDAVTITHTGDITTSGINWNDAIIVWSANCSGRFYIDECKLPRNGGTLAADPDNIGSTISVTHTGDLTTHNISSRGIWARGFGNHVEVRQYGNIETYGSHSEGIIAEAQDGGGTDGVYNATILQIGNIHTRGGSTSDGLLAIAAGNGNATVTQIGEITSDLASGIYARSAGSGDVTVTKTGDITAYLDGIRTKSYGGNINIILGADATDIDGNPISGANITTTNETGGTRAAVKFIGGADNTLTTYNEVTLDSADGISIIATTPRHHEGDWNIPLPPFEPWVGNETIINHGHLTTLGRIVLREGDDSIVNYGHLSAVGIIDFGTGDNSFINEVGAVSDALQFVVQEMPTSSRIPASGYVIPPLEDEPGTLSIDNRGTINSSEDDFAIDASGGQITVDNSGTINGRVQLSAFDDTVTNSGVFNATADSDFGDGTDLFTNTGTTLITGTVTFTGLEHFQNDGTIDMTNGSTDDQLILPGSYDAAGVLAIDVNFDGTGSADVLTVGGAATGSTAVVINHLSTSPSFGIDVLVVDAGDGSEADAFNVPAISGFLAYGVVYDADSNDYYLSNTVGAPVFRTLKVMEGAQSLWYSSAEIWGAHMATRRDTPNGTPQLWFELHSTKASRDRSFTFSANDIDQAIDLDYDQNSTGFQMGYESAIAGENTVIGLTGGYISSRLEFDASPDRVRYAAWNFGAYAGYQADGFYANALFKYDFVSADVRAAPSGYNADLGGKVYGVRGEAGYRWEADSLFVEPVASIEYQRASLDDIVALGATIDFGRWDGLRGMAGVRIGHESNFGVDNVLTVYGSARAVHEFEGAGDLSFTSGASNYRRANSPIDTYGRINLGANLVTHGISSFFIEGTADIGGDYQGFGGRGGFRIRL